LGCKLFFAIFKFSVAIYLGHIELSSRLCDEIWVPEFAVLIKNDNKYNIIESNLG